MQTVMNIRKSIPETLSILILLLASLALAGCGGAGVGETDSGNMDTGSGEVVATLSWTPPAENTDGSELTDLEEYKFYVGDSPDNLQYLDALPAKKNGKNVTEYRITDDDVFSITGQPSSGNMTVYFAMTACNSLGIESDRSEVVSKTF